MIGGTGHWFQKNFLKEICGIQAEWDDLTKKKKQKGFGCMRKGEGANLKGKHHFTEVLSGKEMGGEAIF